MKKYFAILLLMISTSLSAQFSIDSVTVYHNNFIVDSVNIKGKTKILKIDRIFTISFNDICSKTPFNIIFKGCTTNTVTTFDTTYSYAQWGGHYTKLFRFYTSWDTSSTCAYPLVQKVTDTLIWDRCHIATNVAEVNTALSKLRVFPNPANKLVFISGNVAVKEIQLYSSSGKLLKIVDKGIREINSQHLPSGVYVVRVELKNGAVVSHKIVVQH